jgi:hypothetical protein
MEEYGGGEVEFHVFLTPGLRLVDLDKRKPVN